MMLDRINRTARFACSALAGALLACGASAQTLRLDRLPAERLEVTPPSERVIGEPGRMRIANGACRASADAGVRRRILDIAVQEWGYFGFNIVDETRIQDDGDGRPRGPGSWRRFAWHDAEESARVAASIAGYWSVTSDGSWILDRQNSIWNGEGIGARWRDPWSAAFISWVMCESGLDREAFRRHIAHHAYIDQAIEARDDPSSTAAFVAFDLGERPIEPGDMVCRVRRAIYRSIDDRRRHLGDGVRSHCDIVVQVEPERGRVLAIGGNVQGKVSLKLLPATFDPTAERPVARSIGAGRRVVFAHMKLRAAPVEDNAFETAPTMQVLAARSGERGTVERRLAGLMPAPPGAPVESPLPSGSTLASP